MNSLQNQIKWFLANTWTETLTDGSAICCCQVKNQENWHWLHCWEGNYSCDKICKPMHYAYMWNGFLFIGFLLANQSLTDARAICCHTTKSILPCLCWENGRTLPQVGMHWEIHPPRPLRFPSGGDFAPLGPRDFPRASPSGNLSGLGGCISQYIPPLGSVRIQYSSYSCQYSYFNTHTYP